MKCFVITFKNDTLRNKIVTMENKHSNQINNKHMRMLVLKHGNESLKSRDEEKKNEHDKMIKESKNETHESNHQLRTTNDKLFD